MRTLCLLLSTVFLVGCAGTPPYQWQDRYDSVRQDPSEDLATCRRYAAAQYRPGMPKGAAYLLQEETKDAMAEEYTHGEWRPDRAPFPVVNRNDLPTHEVDIEYTGYPGELDYSPGYLDAILEKCMFDKGWIYAAVTDP